MILFEKGQIYRILEIYDAFLAGNKICKKEIAASYCKNERTIQRDLALLKEYVTAISCKKNEIIFDAKNLTYSLQNDSQLDSKRILMIVKILVESRAFSKEEFELIKKNLFLGFNSSELKTLKINIENENFYYMPTVNSKKNLSTIVWTLAECIRLTQEVKTLYVNNDQNYSHKILQPVGIIFSEYYFYLIAYEQDIKHPKIYRIDRIQNIEILEHFRLSESRRVELAEYHNKIQFMYSGKKRKISLEIDRYALPATQDKLPTLIVKETRDKIVLAEAEVYGTGIIMWLLSQGSKIKLLGPTDLVDILKGEIKKMANIYEI